MSSGRIFTQIFFSNSTWTVPAGVRWVIVSGCGGGGGGGAGACSTGPTREFTMYNAGGSGGQAAATSTQIVEVAPGTTYTVTIGSGGAGGVNSSLTVVGEPGNGNAFPYNYNNGGNSSPGANGANGSASSFGSVSFLGGAGGEGGQLILASTVITNRTLNVQNHTPIRPAFCTVSGLTGPANRGGGGGGGGSSNNFYSTGGVGGQGAFGVYGFNFALGGGNGTVGGGGGGGGGGENKDFSDTGNGAAGGNGGNGFMEVIWIA